MRTRRSIVSRLLLAFLLIIFVLPTSVAEDDVVCFTAMVPGRPVTDVIYYGERSVGLTLVFGHNCSNWSIEVSSPLFGHSLRGLNPEEIEAGKNIVSSIAVNPDASFRTYDVTAYLNYTNEEGEAVNRSYDFNLTLLPTWRMVDVHVPEGGDHQLSVTFETFRKFHNVTIHFGGDGNVGVEDERIVLEDVEPGNHTVRTTVVRVDSWAGNAQEVNWHIIGVVENRTLEKAEYNIPVDVGWGIPGFAVPLVLLATVGAMLMMRKGRRRR